MRAKIWIALGTIYVVWGSTFLAIAVVVRDLPPFLSMALRHLVAGALLFGWVMVRHRDRDRIGWRQWRAAFVFGGALFLVGHGLLAWAQQDVPSGIAALLVGTIPLWFAILARIFMGERLGGRALAGLVLGFAGLALLVDPSGQEGAEPIGAPEGHAPGCSDGHARRRRAARGRERRTRGVERRDVLRRRAACDRVHGRRRLP